MSKMKPTREPETLSIAAEGANEKSKFLEIELQQSLETFRVQFNLLMQVSLGIIAANVAFLGYALQQRRASLLCIGAGFPLLLLAVLNRGRRFMVPVLLSAIHLEHSTLGSDRGLVSTFLAHVNGIDYTRKLLDIRKINGVTARQTALRSMPLPFGHRGLMRAGAIASSCAQVLAGVLLWHFKTWPVI
jgi:hypothetical protein